MSVHVMPEHQAAYFTCDHLGGKPEQRSTCRAAITVQPEQCALWIDPATIVPDGWERTGRGVHLCPDHRGSTSHCSLIWGAS